jgi:DNA-binding SARP family transcriptional activator
MMRTLAREQHRLARKIGSASMPLNAIFAPAGFGKAEIARAIAEEAGGATVVFPTAGSDLESLLIETVNAFGVREGAGHVDPSHAQREIARLWSAPGAPQLLILHETQGIADTVLRALLSALLAVLPSHGRILITADREPTFVLNDILEPHQTLTLRRGDLALSIAGMSELADAQQIDTAMLYAIFQLSAGWPVVAQYLLRLAAEGRLQPTLLSLEQEAWIDLFDWVDVAVIKPLPPGVFAALLHTTVCMDALPSEFEAESGKAERTDELRLRRDYQLAELGISGEVRTVPFLRWFLNARYATALAGAAESAVRRRLDDGQLVRAARVRVNVGDVAGAAAILPKVGATAGELGDYGYPGSILEGLLPARPTYSAFPSIWFGLLSARRFVVSPIILADEAEEALASVDLDATERSLLLTATIALCVEAADFERANAYARELEGTAGAGESLLEIARTYLDIGAGNYKNGRERWRRLQRVVIEQRGCYAFTLRYLARTMRMGDVPRIDEVARRIAAVVRLGAAPQIAIAALCELAGRDWVAGNAESFRTIRDELLAFAANYDAPLLAGTIAATAGVDVKARDAGDPYYDVWCALFRASTLEPGAPRSAAFAAAVRAADRCGDVLLRAESRLWNAREDESQRAALVAQAAEIAASCDDPAVALHVAALVDAPSATLRIDPVVPIHAAPPQSEAAEVPLLLDVLDAAIVRDGEAVKISEKGLELLTYLAVSPGPVPRDRVLDALWPELDADAAVNALKACVHRIRTQLNDPSCIVVENSTYRLGASIDSNYRRILEMAAVQTGSLTETERSHRENAFERLALGRMRARTSAWEWFAGYSQALDDAWRSIGESLARDALARRAFQDALRIARMMSAHQPLDEVPRALAIEAFALMQNRPMALAEYRDYRELLRRELGVEPSPSLRELASK